MSEKSRNIISIGIMALSTAFIGIGMYRNEALSVLNKAVTVCLECIGIG